MNDARIAWWTQGEHHGLVWSNGIALLDTSLGGPVVQQVWDALEPGATLTGFFSILGDATGRALLDLPGFAVAIRSANGRTQLAARGDFTAGTLAHGAEQAVLGAEVSTWSEAQVDDATALFVSALGDRGAALVRPIVGGVVPASALSTTDELAARVPGKHGLATGDLGADADSEPAPDARSAPYEEAVSDAEEPHLDSPAVDLALEAAADPAGGADQSHPVDGVPGQDEETEDEPRFGHLWGEHTILEPIENAAVRPPDDSEPAAADAPTPRSADETWIEPAVDDGSTRIPAGEQATVDPEPAPAEPVAFSGFISSVPKPGGVGPSAEPSVLGGDRPGMDGDSPPIAAPTDEPDDGLGDHDGHTVLDLAEPDPQPGQVPSSGSSDGLLAVLCSRGHANPPQRADCRVCGDVLSAATSHVARPSLGQIVLNTGEVVELTGPIVIGRDPKAARFQGTEIPRTLPIPLPHVSSNHLEIRLEGWSVLAQDLHSTNGTFLRRHGEPPFRLPESPQLIVVGDILDLGHGVHISFREIP